MKTFRFTFSAYKEWRIGDPHRFAFSFEAEDHDAALVKVREWQELAEENGVNIAGVNWRLIRLNWASLTEVVK